MSPSSLEIGEILLEWHCCRETTRRVDKYQMALEFLYDVQS